MPKVSDRRKRLKQARLAAGVRRKRDFPKAELGRAVGFSGQSVGDWESGVEPDDLQTIVELARTLGVQPCWLAFGLSEMEPPTGVRVNFPRSQGVDFGAKKRRRKKEG